MSDVESKGLKDWLGERIFDQLEDPIKDLLTPLFVQIDELQTKARDAVEDVTTEDVDALQDQALAFLSGMFGKSWAWDDENQQIVETA